MDEDSDAELARAIAASLSEDAPPAAVSAAAPAVGTRAGEGTDADEAYARALQASMDEAGPPSATRLAQRSTGLPASFALPSPTDARPFTPREPAMQEAIMASTRVQNREEDELSRALAASLAEGSDGSAAPAAEASVPATTDGDDDLAAAIAASMSQPAAERERPAASMPSAMESFASIADLPAAAGLSAHPDVAGGLDAAALAATMGLTIDPVPAGLAALGLPPAIGREAGGAGASAATGGMSEDEQISAAVMASTEDDMERAIMMSLADGGASEGVDGDSGGRGSGLAAVEAAGAAAHFEPMPAATRLDSTDTGGRPGMSQADADEADDIAQAIAVSMGQPIDRGRRPVGAAAVHRQPQPETPPGVRAARLERQEQDQAYQAGLMEDETRRIMEETAAQAAEDARAEEARQRESEQASMRQELERLEEEFSSQPEPEAGTEGLTEIMIELPTGERATRRFGKPAYNAGAMLARRAMALRRDHCTLEVADTSVAECSCRVVPECVFSPCLTAQTNAVLCRAG